MDRFLVFARRQATQEWESTTSEETRLTTAMRLADAAVSAGFERACVMEIIGSDAVPLFKFRYLAAGETLR